jgi:ribosomal protein S6--L-glutamate ligase
MKEENKKDKLKAAIVSLGGTSSHWIADSMRKYFETVDMIDIRDVEVLLESKKMKVMHRGEEVKGYDCILVRGSFRYTAMLTALTSVLQQESYVPVSADAISACHDKFLTQLKLQEHKIAMPSVYMASTGDSVRALLEKLPYPVVMKLPHGTQGKGVMFADSFASASSLIDALATLRQPFIIQDYIDTGGKDIRAIVVGEKVVASMMRISQSQEARANIHAGGKGEAIKLDMKTQQLAIKAARAMGAEICGVDILEGPTGPMILEVNVSPGLKGITAATGIDVAGEMAKYLFERTKELKKAEKTIKEKEVMKEIGNASMSEIVTTLDFKANRILLPEFVNKLAELKSEDEVIIKAEKGKVTIEKE